MKTFGIAATLTAALLFGSSPTPAEAGRGCGRHGGRSGRVVRVVPAPPAVACVPQSYAMAAPVPAQASPQYQASPQAAVGAAPMPMAAPAQAVAAPVAEAVSPTYAYQATPGGAAAYYYTYDKDDRLIPVQWMDWLFRGGRAAGEPRPPLPIIGRLQDR